MLQSFSAAERTVIKDRAGIIYYTFPVVTDEECIGLGKGSVNLRDTVPLTRQICQFDVPVTPSTSSNSLHQDKHQLRATILAMREQGMSYRQIGKALGIHWTRVGQILKRYEILTS